MGEGKEKKGGERGLIRLGTNLSNSTTSPADSYPSRGISSANWKTKYSYSATHEGSNHRLDPYP